MGSRFYVFALATMLARPASADMPAPLISEPTGNWSAQGDDGRCVLTRAFAVGQSRAALSVEALPLNDKVELTWRTDELGGPLSWGPGKVEFGDGGQPIAVRFQTADLPDGRHAIRRVSILRGELDRSATSGLLNLSTANWQVRIRMERLNSALSVLDRCNQALQSRVGLSPADVAKIVRAPVPPQVLYRIDPGYRAQAQKGDPEDEAVARYLVDSRGKVTGCGLVHRATSDVLNNGACGLANVPLKFTPARDVDGKAIDGLYFERDRW